MTMKHHFTAHTTRWYNCDPVSSTGYTVLSRIESERTHTTIGPHQMTLFQHTPNRTGTGPNSSQTPTRTYHDGVCHWKPPQMTHQVGGRGSPAPRNQQKKHLKWSPDRGKTQGLRPPPGKQTGWGAASKCPLKALPPPPATGPAHGHTPPPPVL